MDFKISLRTRSFPRIKVLYYGSKYITFRLENEDVLRTIIFQTFHGMCIQIMFSKEQLWHDHSYDNEYADKAVEWLKSQVDSYPEKLGASLNQAFWHFYMLRKFENIYCVLKVLKTEFYNLPAKMINQLNTLKHHNLLDYNGQIINDRDIIKSGVFLVRVRVNPNEVELEWFVDYA